MNSTAEEMIQLQTLTRQLWYLAAVCSVILYSALLKIRILADKRVRYNISDHISTTEIKFLKNI